jgi:hypothetical protein
MIAAGVSEGAGYEAERLGSIPRRPKKSARKRTGTPRVGRIPAGPMVRIRLPPDQSHTNSIIATSRPGARSERSAKGQDHGRAGVNFGTASCFPHRRTLNGPQ